MAATHWRHSGRLRFRQFAPIQSLILAALLLGLGFFMVIVGLVADLISVNRKLLEGLDWRLQKMEEHMHGRSGEPGRA